MADDFRRVTPGQPFRPTARAWNAMLDAAEAAARGQSLVPPTARSQAIVRIKNTTASNVGLYGVLGISGILFTQAESEDEFYNRWTLTGTTPAVADHAGKFAVAAEPIPAGEIGRAIVVGATPAAINVTSAAHGYATVKASDLTQLDSAAIGPARILYKPSGTGTLWGIVVLGAHPTGHLFPVKIEKTGGSDGTQTTAASWTYTVTDLSGTQLGTTVAVSRPRPKGKMTFQSGSSGYGLAFYDGATLKLWDAGEIETAGACT